MKIRIYIFFILAIVLGGCSRQVEIPEDKFGLLLRLGKIEGVVSGPRVIDKPMSTTILLLTKSHEILIQQGQFRFGYEITDPKEYYIRFGIRQVQLQQFIEKMIASHANNVSNISELVNSLNLPIAVNMYCRMPC